ncbi:DSD1 family PLP-dependent enzyme [Variovorax dokdonensis]|uniref:DSD1 family PLP-dependent enzyme n=1 Tax=Variovorax dokdonensis TaxID=344883 RepID=A0ABT7NDP5_9BURK|nr:DSD1 family PLP-dependent enzyme [Variovorax dokdonensis]MDM0046081.1 DSD1 family PLP-dependent enzyme [Variovorax dokdonensis]
MLLAALGTATASALVLRPSDRGAPYDDYFRALNLQLKESGPMRPCMVIDLDRLDFNLDLVLKSLKESGRHYRIVEKSLPCEGLINYVMQRSGSQRLMSFHQPFLNNDARVFPGSDILLGKPLPAASAALFYEQLKPPFDPKRQLQWLIDTPARLSQYLELARGIGTRMRINIEIDVGLHRGGVAKDATLACMLDLIEDNQAHLEFSGFMGYDAHVGFGVPSVLGTPEELLARAMAIYQCHVDHVRSRYPALWNDRLTLNTGGSPSYKLHKAESLSTEVSVGTALLKPTHYDIPTLADHVPAAFIATPVLKATGPVRLPALDERSKVFSWWDVNQRETFYIYGGYWLAEYESPKGLQTNQLLGRSANQENVMASPSVGLMVDDHVFLRPTITEGVLLQFGDLLAIRRGRIEHRWPVYGQSG